MRGAILVRVSTLEQGKKGYSIPEQLAVGHERAEKLGCTQVDEYIEEESGAFMDTPGLDIFKDALKTNGYKYVICLDPDRLARNLVRQLVVANDIERAGAELVFIHGEYANTPEGRLFFAIRGAISEYEREKIRERTQSGLRRKALSGKVPRSGRPYGYTYDKTTGLYVINEDEAQAVRLMFEWIWKERATLYEVCRRLAELGIQTKRSGGVWRTSTVAGIVHNSLYYGEAVAFRKIRKKIAPGQFKTGMHPKDNWVIVPVPAIVSREEFEAAQVVLKNNYERAPRNTKNPYLLQGLVRCPVCRRIMGICYDGRVTLAYFFCRTGTKSENREPRSPKCGVRMIPMPKLEESVDNMLYYFASNPKSLRGYLTREDIEEDSSAADQLVFKLKRLNQKQEEFNKERERIARLFRKKLITEDNVEKQLGEIAKEEAETKAQVESISMKLNRRNRKTGELNDFIDQFTRAMLDIKTLPYADKKGAIEFFIQGIYPRRTDKANNTKFCQLDLDIEFKV